MRHTHQTARSDAAPLTTPQRLLLHDLLDRRWRERVVELTELAVQFHAAEAHDPDEVPSVLAQRLAHVRRNLVDIEAALKRLDSRSYGRCDGCERRMPFEQLELRPEARFCFGCQPKSSA
jgi:DnaK suppressor protein